MLRCSCGGGHETFGACLRDKNFRIGYCRSHVGRNPAQHDATSNRKHEENLDRYRDARRQGVRPAGTSNAAIRFALDQSDRRGRAFDAADPLKGVEL